MLLPYDPPQQAGDSKPAYTFDVPAKEQEGLLGLSLPETGKETYEALRRHKVAFGDSQTSLNKGRGFSKRDRKGRGIEIRCGSGRLPRNR